MSASTRSAGALREATPLYVTFDDNALLPSLFGAHDQNLARIEQRLGVALVSRGNRVAITGAPQSSETAKRVLEHILSDPDWHRASSVSNMYGASISA